MMTLHLESKTIATTITPRISLKYLSNLAIIPLDIACISLQRELSHPFIVSLTLQIIGKTKLAVGYLVPEENSVNL